MGEIHSGRRKKELNMISKKQEEKKRSICAADAAAVVCALLCAIALCMFGGGNATLSQDSVYQTVGTSGLGTVTYTPPEEPEAWNFWDYLSDVMAGVFGYGEYGQQ